MRSLSMITVMVGVVALAAASSPAALTDPPPEACLRNGTLAKRCPPDVAITTTTTRGVFAFVATHTVRWTDDGAGPIDTLVVRDSLPGQPTQSQKFLRPTSPVTFAFSWPNPAPASSVTGTLRAQSKRRAAASAWAAKAWTHLEPDVTPPVPTIDSTLLVLGIEVTPAALTLKAGEARQLCAWVLYGNRKLANRAVQRPQCDSMYTRVVSADRRPSAAQMARADSVCVGWVVGGGTIPVEPCANPATRWSSTARDRWPYRFAAVVPVTVLPAAPKPKVVAERAAP